MSYLGRRVVRFNLDARWREAHLRGALHRHERARILAGDHSAIVRELEPAFEPGSSHVLSWSRPRGSVDHDALQVVKPPPEPLFWIVIRKVVRHRNGTWRVRFDVFDRRMRTRLIRRKPPAAPTEDEAAIDEAQAREDSAYTTNPREAVDHADAVDDATLARFAAEAEQTQLLRRHGSVGSRLQAIEELPARDRVVELHKLASEQGIDCRDDLKAFERRLKRRMGLAA